MSRITVGSIKLPDSVSGQARQVAVTTIMDDDVWADTTLTLEQIVLANRITEKFEILHIVCTRFQGKIQMITY